MSDDDKPQVTVRPADTEDEWDAKTPLPYYGIPTLDMEDAGEAQVPYLHYVPEETKVVSGPIGPAKKFPGTMFVSKAAARSYWLGRAGRVLEDLSVPGRWIFRVRKDA